MGFFLLIKFIITFLINYILLLRAGCNRSPSVLQRI